MLLLFILTGSLNGQLTSLKCAVIILIKLGATGCQFLMKAQTGPSVTLLILRETVLRSVFIHVWAVYGVTLWDLIANPIISRKCPGRSVFITS